MTMQKESTTTKQIVDEVVMDGQGMHAAQLNRIPWVSPLIAWDSAKCETQKEEIR